MTVGNRSKVDHRDPKVRKKIADLYRGGLPVRCLFERFGNISDEVMRAICKEHGVEMRGRRGQKFMNVDAPA